MFGLQTKLYAAGAAILAFLAFFVRHKAVVAQRDKAKQKVVDLTFKTDVLESDAEITQEFSDLKREAEQDVKDGTVPSNLRDPNKF